MHECFRFWTICFGIFQCRKVTHECCASMLNSENFNLTLREIQPATYDVLSNWLQQQKNRREAYIDLQAGLIRAEMNQLATELKQWVERTEAEIDRTPEEGRKKFISISAVIVKLITQHKHL